jgi:hypothetical protein
MSRRPAARIGLLAMLSLAALGLAMPGAAQARSPEDCEKLTNWHAYNTCLASFGPRRGQRVTSGQPQAADPEQRGRRSASGRAAARPTPGLSVQRISGGRVRATLDVTAPRRR